MSKRILSLLLAMVMLLSVVPFQALAEDVTETEATAMEETQAPAVPETTVAPVVPEITVAPTVPETTEAPAVEPTQAPTVEPTEASAPTEPAQETEPVVAAQSVTVSQEDELNALAVGSQLQLTALVLPENAQDKTVVWTSSDETVATVDETGLVTGIGTGAVTVTAACGEVTGTYELIVSAPVDTLEVKNETAQNAATTGSIVTTPAADSDPAEREVLAGEALTLTAKDGDKVFLWKFVDPDDAGYARLTPGGILTPDPKAVLERRTVQVQPYNRDNKEEVGPVIELTLIPRISRITLKVNDEDVTNGDVYVNIGSGSSVTISADIGPRDSRQKVKWSVSSEDSDLYTNRVEDDTTISLTPMDKTGLVTVTATSADKDSTVKAITTIHFVKLATSVEIKNLPEKNEKGDYFMIGGDKRTLTTNLATESGLSDRNVIWQVIDAGTDADEDDNYPDSKYATIGKYSGNLVTKAVEEQRTIIVKAWVAADMDVTPAEATIVLYPGASSVTAKAVGVEDGKVELSQKTVALEAEVKSEEAIQNVQWIISNSNLAYFETEVNGQTKKVSSITDTLTPTLHLKAAGNVRITAKAVDGSGKYDFVNLKITAPAKKLVITKNDGKTIEEEETLKLASNGNMTLKAQVWSVYDGLNEDNSLLAENQKVKWYIGVEDDNGKLVRSSAASISSAGRIAAGTVEENTTVTVRAVSVEDEDVYDAVDVVITPQKVRTLALFAEGGKFSETQDKKLSGTVLLDAGTVYKLYGKYYDREQENYFDVTSDCTFRSTNARVASVDEDGDLTTGKSGSADIYVYWTDDANGGRMQTVKVTVKVQALVNEVEIAQPKNLYVRSGSSLRLKATAWSNKTAGTKAANQKFTWSVVDLDDDGNPKDSSEFATMSGSTLRPKSVTEMRTVRVFARSAENDMTAYIDIAILPKAACQLTLSFNDMDGEAQTGTVVVPVNLMDAGNLNLALYQSIVYKDGYIYTDSDESLALNDEKITWKTSNKKIVAIEDDLPVFKGTGKVTLTARYNDKDNKQSATAKITLNLINAVTEIEISTKVAGQELVAGRSISLTAVVKADNDGTQVKPYNKSVVWSFADEDSAKYATINPRSGVVTAKKTAKAGDTVTVIATAADGYGVESNELPLTICALAEKVTIDSYEDGYVVPVKLSETANPLSLHATVNPDNASQNVKWTSSSSSYASVDQEGNVTIKRANRKVKITATATDGSGKKAYIILDIKD